MHDEAGPQTCAFLSLVPTVTFFSLSQASEAVRFLFWATLLSPSSSRTRNLHRPARLNLLFYFPGARGSISKGGGISVEIPSPYPSVKPKATLGYSEPTGGRPASSCLCVSECV